MSVIMDREHTTFQPVEPFRVGTGPGHMAVEVGLTVAPPDRPPFAHGGLGPVYRLVRVSLGAGVSGAPCDCD